tara:strand:+ start:7262 stop:7636 length:375 start_codon:yes stop_codon:yes gene_type:complete
MWQYELNDSAENWNYQKFNGYSGRYSFHQDRRSLTMYRYSRKLVERAVMQRFFILFLVILGGASLVGCQVDISGQTLPSAYYLQDDIQYFPAGPEFKLSKEAAALKAYKDQNGGDAPTNCDTCR